MDTLKQPVTYPSLQAFYSEDPRRERSGEADYGVHWRSDQGWASPRWRVSYIQATGEVYALELGGRSRVEVLGIVPPDDVPVGQVYYRTLDKLLEGWSDEGNRPLSWVRGRLDG